MFKTIYRTLLLACFSMWFGGFGFYVSIVVPIGTDILGSARNQGMITQQVTDWLNLFAGIAVVAMLLESYVSWKSIAGFSKWWLLSLAVLVSVFLGGLVWLHPVLDAMIDPSEMEISDEAKFYQLHRLYLWLSTIQWIAAWAWLIVLSHRWSRTKTRAVEGVK